MLYFVANMRFSAVREQGMKMPDIGKSQFFFQSGELACAELDLTPDELGRTCRQLVTTTVGVVITSAGEILLSKDATIPRPLYWIPEALLLSGESLEESAQRAAEEALEIAISATRIRTRVVSSQERFNHIGTYMHYWGDNGGTQHVSCWVMGIELTVSERRELVLNGKHQWVTFEKILPRTYGPALVRIAQDARDWRINTRHS